MLAAERSRMVLAMQRRDVQGMITFDISMHLSLAVKVLQTSEELARKDGDIVFSEYAGFELQERGIRVGNDASSSID